MSQGRKGRMNYRCPACFVREIDVDMFYDKDMKEYYCLRCPFTGTEAEVLKLNEMAKFRYKSMLERITRFD
jgi:DNA-directed RNA polymerase subunit RPC12/RpoP